MHIALAILGAGLLVIEFLSFRFLRRALRAGQLPQPWRRRRIIAFVLGGLLISTIPWQAYPLDGGTAAGIPFLAAWYDAQGRDFIGAITLPALLGNALVWFLLPQSILAYRARQHSRTDEENQTHVA